jgi:AcrR family transcriptional regulator
MPYLRTVMEKAIEWGITPRYVQFLCHNKKINGVIKQAGAWFIPDDTPNPKKNHKSDEVVFKFTGTKEKIFHNAIRQFMQNGYENVSIKDIAEASKIQASAVYNHFKSKQCLLDTMYEFYRYSVNKNIFAQNNIETFIQKGSLMDFIKKGLLYEYETEINEQLAGINHIIYQRLTYDTKAAQLFRDYVLKYRIEYIESGLNRAVELGKLAPHDSRAIALHIHCTRFFFFVRWWINPSEETRKEALDDQHIMFKQIVSLLTDLKSTAQSKKKRIFTQKRNETRWKRRKRYSMNKQ